MAEPRTASPGEGAAVLADDLLTTKYCGAPRIRADRLARPRLIARLDESVAKPLVVVCTPPGFGKTTLLADWAAGATRPVGWLSLDPGDNDPVRFWRYVLAALDPVRGSLGERLQPLLTEPGMLSRQAALTALINELEAGSEKELVLVLDDYHLVDSPAIHEDMAFLLSRVPPQFHLVVASRSDPPLPLARLRASGELAELRAADLRFTPEESTAYLRDVCGLDLSTQAIADLDARTEGWAVGLQLAALSLQERPDLDAFLHAFTGSHRYVLDYLSEEVLEQQPEPVQTFLLRTSILDRLTGPLCDAVTGGTGGQDTLEDLERANLFLVPLDEQRRWYRLHHLFADLLRARLQRVEPDRVPDLHRSAAAWHEHHGLIHDAIKHALAAADTDWAARLVEQHLNGTLQRGETAELARWISALPGEVVSSRPGLCLAEGLMEFHAGHLDAVERCLTHAQRAFDQGRHQQLQVPTDGGMVSEIPAAIALLRAEVAAARGDADWMAESANSALEHTAEHERGPRIWAGWFLACAAWMRGRVTDAEPAFARVLAEARTASAAYPMMATCLPLGRVQHARGRLGDALRTYEDGLRFATEDSGLTQLYHAAEAHLGIAMVRYERDELTDALEHVTAGLDAGRQVVDLTTPVLGLVTLAWTRQALGDSAAALDAMDEACRLRSPNVVAMWNPAPAERARLLLAQGRVEEAAAWARERGLVEDDDAPFPQERDYLVLARVLLAHGVPDRVLRLLDSLDRRADAQGRVHSLIKIRAVRALALQATGDHHSALSVLSQALTLARPEGYIRAFADEGPPMSALLRSMVSARPRSRVAGDTEALRRQVSRILRACEPGVVTPGIIRTPGLVEPLTRRELEVLPLLSEGLSNREIAQQLVVTLDTVKKHISHILSKLGATSRTQAVTKARELGLLS